MDFSVRIERWPLAGAFTISCGSRTEAVVVVVELGDGTHRGCSECVPYARYGETPDGIVAAIGAMRPALDRGLDRMALQDAMSPGAARNALDCAYWDVNARRTGRRAYELAGLVAPVPRVTAYTISLVAPAAMAEAAERAASRPLLKVKLGGADDDDGERIAAVRRAAPRAELIVDANEGWTEDNLAQNLAACAAAGVTLIEQPLPEGRDGRLGRIKRPIPVCADESVHDRASLDGLVGKYDAVNIKLDKAVASPRRWRWPRRHSGADSPLWSAAWWRPRWRWRRPCWWRSARAWSISTVRCCSSRIDPTRCAITAVSSTRPSRRCGGEPRPAMVYMAAVEPRRDCAILMWMLAAFGLQHPACAVDER